MKFVADLHIHSHYSMATSKHLIPEQLDYWAKIKGIQVVGTGDFTHPGWLKELKEKLIPAEEGLFKLKDELIIKDDLTQNCTSPVRFMLTAEISNIYKKKGKVRKIHNVLFAPDFDTVMRFQQRLQQMNFNITSDGRPILGLDSRDLLEIALEINEDIFFVPAHIWTPWFSALGAKSGFDTIDACYDDLAHHVHAVETGLSSDPAMNWMCGFLDRFTLISNSDAHSPEKLGREANYFDTDMDYPSMMHALKNPSEGGFKGTIEFFPQEGKYHFDGHRKCNISWNPLETLAHHGICPVCGKPVTIGVLNRTAELADRDSIERHPRQNPFDSIIPLKEIISEIEGVGKNSKTVGRQYHQMIHKLGSEFDILLNQPAERIAQSAGALYGDAVRRMRQRRIHIQEGFDGEFGVVRVFNPEEIQRYKQQSSFFMEKAFDCSAIPARALLPFDLLEYQGLLLKNKEAAAKPDKQADNQETCKKQDTLNAMQMKAVLHETGPMMILAGPGTGKTRTLIARIARLIHAAKTAPQSILAITFTRKAAEEMQHRIAFEQQNKSISGVNIDTFHGFGHALLKNHAETLNRQFPFVLIDEMDKRWIFQEELGLEKDEIKPSIAFISQFKQQLKNTADIPQPNFKKMYNDYQAWLEQHNAFDLDDLISQSYHLLIKNPEILSQIRKQYQWIFIDEYQDVNTAQYELIRLFAPESHSNLCVIGDPNQAIYGFRGADNRYIQQFQQDYTESTVYTLTQSYRCTHHILETSGQLVSDPPALQGLHRGVRVQISCLPTDKSEAEFVARTIESMMGGLRFFSMDSQISDGNTDTQIDSLSDFAVLCRTHQQIGLIEKAFQDHSIPCHNTANLHHFNQPPIKNMIDVLRSVHLSKDSWHSEFIFRRQKTNFQTQHALIASLLAVQSIEEKIKLIQQTLFPNFSGLNDSSYLHLIKLAREYGDNINAFIQAITLAHETDLFRKNIEAVHLMTLHASKGLEFKCVFITGCEDKLLPYSLFNKRCSIEEEKRLLYVGMTRAKNSLILTHAQKRLFLGKMHASKRSPFIDVIEKELLEIRSDSYAKKKGLPETQMNLF